MNDDTIIVSSACIWLIFVCTVIIVMITMGPNIATIYAVACFIILFLITSSIFHSSLENNKSNSTDQYNQSNNTSDSYSDD